jgi:hypothetical protein
MDLLGHSSAGTIMSIENMQCPQREQSHDRPICITVLEPTKVPHVPILSLKLTLLFIQLCSIAEMNYSLINAIIVINYELKGIRKEVVIL